MKKLFTFAFVALAAASANAQTESWAPYETDGTNYTLKADYVPNAVESEMSVVKFSTTNVEGEHTSGAIKGYKQGPNLPLEAEYNNTWENLGNMNNLDGTRFYYARGKGNPAILDRVTMDNKVYDKDSGEWTGDYKEDWNGAWYQFDGSAGLPQQGSYLKFTTKVDGELKVGVQIWKDWRDVYVVKGSDAKALHFTTDVKFNGYIENDKWTIEDGLEPDDPMLGTLKFHENMQPIGTEGIDAYIFSNQKTWGEMVFNAKAGESYWIFIKKSQIGFNGFSFTPSAGSGITEITTSTDDVNAPVYNLAGQRVGKDAKGILIQNGKKFIRK